MFYTSRYYVSEEKKKIIHPSFNVSQSSIRSKGCESARFSFEASLRKLFDMRLCNNCYMQTSAEREHDKNLSVFRRSICITVSSSVRINIVYKLLCLLMPFIILQNNRSISLKTSRKKSVIFSHCKGWQYFIR